ncbi:basic salivary proline-rich protein 2-like [Prinia subflava]|uniref:basic salivary proline-rich protein 2-like n=1 Tax=Prinia subflava TaxID=208062 RepID=UPI002FE37613
MLRGAAPRLPPLPPLLPPPGPPERGTRSAGPVPERSPREEDPPAPGGGDGGSGKGEGEAGREGDRAPLSPSPGRPHGTVRSSGREPQSNIEGAAGCAPGQPPVPPSRERHRCSAERTQPNRAAAPRAPT